jgi:CBS domain-containing protein
MMTSENERYALESLRTARAAALSDAEGFPEVLFALERVGIALSGIVGALREYRTSLRELALRSPLATALTPLQRHCHIDFDPLFEIVREARNDALHHGAFARHLTRHAVELCLLLEDGLMSNATVVADFMVRDPVSAELWQPLSLIRQQMLANSFSYLPVHLKDGSWGLLADLAIARAVARSLGTGKRKEALASTLEEALANRSVEISAATVIFPSETVETALAKCDGRPLLVADGVGRLVGILTSFDLL